MEFSIATLLANFEDEKLVAPKVLEKKLGATENGSLRKLQIVLDALERIGILVKDRGRYKRVYDKQSFVEGKLRCSSKGFCFAIQDAEDTEDIYIRESNLSTAWNGDQVLVKILKEGSRRRSPEGEVQLILDRAITSVLGRVKRVNGDYKAVPLDDRLLFELDIKSQEAQNLKEAVDHLVHVEILRYPLGQHPPIGRVTQVLGSNAEEAADTEIVRCKHNLPKEFPPEVLAAAAPFRKNQEMPPPVSEEKRLDLRQLLTITIKPGASKDSRPETLDDAISLDRTEAGYWRVGVHIADVAEYVLPDDYIDQEASKRGASVYLGEKVLPMLPEAVAAGCCLVPEVDRLAVSVFLTLDSEGQLIEFEFQRTIVRVNYQLSYQQVREIINKETKSFPRKVAETLSELLLLTQGLREQRLKRGSFDLNLPDKKFYYDDEGTLGALVVSPQLPERSIITELMILVNQVVATHLQALSLPLIYRVHSTPHMEEVQELIKLAGNLGIELELAEEDVVTPVDYKAFTGVFAQSSAQKVFTNILMSTLKPAAYSTTPKPHFGLALDEAYTHFTSPLQRYCDLLVHRILHALFEQGRDRRTSRAKESVNLCHSSCHNKINWKVLPPDILQDFEDHFTSVAAHLSEKERIAQEAQEDLDGLQKAEFMKAHTGEIFSGMITGVQSYGFFVELEDVLVEGLVHVSSLKDDWYEYRSRQQILVGRKNRNQYRLGSRVEVQVKSVDYYRQQIDLIAVSGGSVGTEWEDDPSDLEPDEYED
ncbi:MAG: VacB/RNase II family 3'-5' exoribonuclease [Hormoscilla sp. SP5CHS1]|nr:VacB/RNase II family 3'-5' exoribonuclease [Hormoscilla sp. SP5CHS1]